MYLPFDRIAPSEEVIDLFFVTTCICLLFIVITFSCFFYYMSSLIERSLLDDRQLLFDECSIPYDILVVSKEDAFTP
uniref:Uncharacterized protein n=1 Tax=Steinernema glaseri TaxID=37863 RepID=A0A1I7YBE9_9BILA